MQAYRFITKISKEGTIQLTENPALFGQEVELIILPKSEKNSNNSTKKKMSALEFVNKWAGFLSNVNDEQIDNAKYDYLMNKHK